MAERGVRGERERERLRGERERGGDEEGRIFGK